MGKRILIIDDEEHIRRMTRLTLETAGYEVGEAADGPVGFEIFGDGTQWDAVLLDQRMPGLDGLEVLRRIKEFDQGARVIMVTAYASVELAVDAMKFGATDFLRKPMTPESLRNAVMAALAKPAQATSRPAEDVGDEHPAPLIQTITMNGFQIVRLPEAGKSAPGEAGERHFIVKNPGGWEREVTVEISDEAVAYVERITRRRIAPESSFWTERAESALATYLWNEGRFPDQRLTVDELSRDDLDIAVRWDGDELVG